MYQTIIFMDHPYLDIVDTECCDAGDSGSGDAWRLQAEHGLKPCFQLGYGRRHDSQTRHELMFV